ncbi:histidine kinase [Hymenobacter roseosalivarius DSM 11622]|uniref:histidine kinase n=1 Tax=Hymenobacter roseosalivarius DSM 11622 TaxID=645990 RepID=A0A1W1V3A8_9BACT|nr:ATP-binding protein [Hymenobacter roseosalivarius]SMB87829.1 histidine kinase [Hymenobacter roseosalivarius DSM 11622]
MRYFLLLVACGLLALPTPTAAQAPVDPAELQTTRLSSDRPGSAQTASARYRYWEANPNSLRQVLTKQRADTARLRTLMHLVDVDPVWSTTKPQVEETAELAVLSARLQRPEQRAYRLLASGNRLYQSKAVAAALDTLQAAVSAFDRLGRPVPMLLSALRDLFSELNLLEARGRYFHSKLAYYRQRDATENMAPCHHGLGGYYLGRGDYNQALSHYLQDVALFGTFNRVYSYTQLAGVGGRYAEWGNTERALHYLQQAVAGLRSYRGDLFYAYKTMAEVYLQRQEYPAARRALDQALLPPTGKELYPLVRKKAYTLTLHSAVLLAQGHIAEARPLLQAAQHLVDSLGIPFYSGIGSLELDATWARYYVAQDNMARAETHWLAAYGKAQQSRIKPLRLAYLRELTRFYQQQGQPGPAARYAVSALALADSLDAREGALHVARYEIEQATEAQQARIARLRQTQQQDAARARRQRNILWAVLGGAVLLGGVAAALYYAFRRSERLKQLVTEQKQDLQSQRDQLDTSLTELRVTQAQLIQKEKMASLGELTAGIAHEIQNPLNFVTNFSDVSAELMLELQEAQLAGDGEEVAALAGDVTENLTKIRQHGQRASGIVRGMLEHARPSTGERKPNDLNALCDEYLRLAYYGLRTKDAAFQAELQTDFAPHLPLVNLVGADIGRVLLNLGSNAFYALQERQQLGEAGYQPTLSVRTIQLDRHVEIQVRDNGMGMNEQVQAKIFQPFFTTKPPGEGTGLGLSLSYDIITQGHGGTLTVESKEGHGTEFTITLPV